MTPFDTLDVARLDARAHADVALLRAHRDRVARLASELDARRELWERPPERALAADERRLAHQLFDRVLAYQMVLDGVARFHMDFWKIDPFVDGPRHARHFAVGFAAYCRQLALGLHFVERTINRPQFEALLDEGSDETGVPRGAYATLKWNVVHVEHVGRVFGAHQYHKLLGLTHYGALRGDPHAAFALEEIDDAYARAKERLAVDGARLFAGNLLDILRDGGHRAFFPIQASVARWMGDVKVHREDVALITRAQADEAALRSRPGDVVLERRNWYLSNVGLPGFWPHAALWVGSPRELAQAFDDDPATRAAYGGAFTARLAARFPEAWRAYTTADARGEDRRVIEAVSEGVVFATARHTLAADYAAAVRPRLPRVEIARALERAFGYWGRPYDFDFDFDTDRELVCSELVYKSYEPRDGARGLRLELERVLGRTTLAPNAIVAQFDRELGTPAQQMDFAWFLDGRERDASATFRDEDAFRATHRRAKWDVAQE